MCPWLKIDGQQAVFFDVTEQKFHIFWWVFWPQDGILLASLLIIAAFGLFAVTVWAGRVWCGFACLQTIWTSIFLWVENFVEGDRNRRIPLDAAPWSLNKLKLKAAKHFLWAAIASVTGITFIAYFYGSLPLLSDIASLTISAERMYDQSTLMVSYDEKRGDSRGARKLRSDYKADCINCGLCIDACDNVMDHMGYQKGLIQFTSAEAITGFWQRFLQPRMLGYSLCLGLMCVLFSVNLGGREPLSIDVIRDRGVYLFCERNGQIENVYMVKLNNMSDSSMEVELSLPEKENFKISGRTRHWLEVGEVFAVPIRISSPVEALERSNYQLNIVAQKAGEDSLKVHQAVGFIAPSKG